MKLLNRIRYYTYFRRLLISYVLTVLFSVIIIAAVLFNLITTSTVREINRNAQSILSQSSRFADNLYDQIQTLSEQLINDRDIIGAMFSNTSDILEDYKVYLKLRNVEGVYSFINYISVYNANTDTYINTKSITKETDTSVVKYFNKQLAGYIYQDFLPRTITITKSGVPTAANILSRIFYSNLSNRGNTKSALIINIDEEYVRNTLKGMSSETDELFIIDNTGRILSHSMGNNFLKDISGENHIDKIIKSDKSRGFSIDNISGEKHLVTYVKSERLEWIFICIRPYKHLLTDIKKLKGITFTVLTVLLLFGLTLSLKLASSLYNPLSSILMKVYPSIEPSVSTKKKFNEYDLITEKFDETSQKASKLEASLKHTYPVIKDTHLRFLLFEGYESAFKSTNMPNETDDYLNSDFFCVAVFKIDDFKSFIQSYSTSDQALLRFAICNISKEVIQKYFENHTVIIDENTIAMIMLLNTGSLSDSFFITLHELQDIIYDYYKLSISIGIGNIVNSKLNLRQSYKNALQCMNYRYFFGHQCVMEYEKIKPQINQEADYPNSTEKKLIDAIQLNNASLIKSLANDFYKYIKRLNYHYAVVYINQLFLALIKYYDNMTIIDNENKSSFKDTISKLSDFETLDEAMDLLLDLCMKIKDTLEEKRVNKNYDLVNEIHQYVNENYHNYNLSLDLLADHVHLSPSYLGRLFKSMTNKSFNDYLTGIRMEKARELLTKTNTPASIICNKVGILNNSYFSTLFKKTYGVTPSHFRNQLNNTP